MSTTERAPRFDAVVESLDEANAVYGPPDEPVQRKVIDHLDVHCRDFITLSPFVLVGTADPEGRCDVSPKGGPAGFVEILDERRLAIPDAKGNRLIDTLRNVAQTGRAGLLFLIPGMEETLRVNGRACLTRDPELLARHAVGSWTPAIAIGVEVEEAYLHCAKAFKRSGLWQEERWPSLEGLARPAQIWRDHIEMPEFTTEAVQEYLDDDYARNLY